jgi:hypothetical protein
VIDPVEEFFEVEIDHDAVALGDVLHCAWATAWWADRPGRKPKLCSENVGSHRFCRTCSRACWISLSTHGTPSFLTPPSGLGISTRLTGCGW